MSMKRRIFVTIVAFFITSASFAQFGVSFHQSNIPFAGLNYEIKDRFLTELRIGTDHYFESVTLEAVLTYQFINKKEVEFYTGFGGRTNGFQGLVLPVGLNFFPLDTDKFGFHIELAPIFGESSNILRGSWGIRYRFRKKQTN